MEKNCFGKNLFFLRKQKNLTQQEVADRLGVTDKAVSKWENGGSYPDITLLPALARIFGQTVDSLLSSDEEPDREEMNRLEHECAARFTDGDFAGALEHCRKTAEKYPENRELSLRVGTVIPCFLTGEEEEQREALELSDRLLETAMRSDEPAIRDSARQMLATNRMRENRYDEAEKLLNGIPRSEAHPEGLLPAVYLLQGKLDEAELLQQRNLLKSVLQAESSLGSLISVALRRKRNEDALKLVKMQEALTELFSIQEFFGIQNEQAYAGIDAAMEKKEETLLHLKRYLEAAARFYGKREKPPQVCDLWIFNRLPSEKDTIPCSITGEQIAESVEQNPKFAFLRDDPEFREMLRSFREKEIPG